ncbi:hypothetical protein GQ42DRAFT_157216 [Ramicandelaber brevisporus]|nr:hypothetical protein GQ42DRAFT_157216 [Ramicandelaber brevisporus]
MAGPRTMHSVLLESAGVAVDGDVSDKSDILLPKSTLELLVQLFGEHYRYPSSIRFCENKDTEHTISFTRQQLQQLQCDVELLSIRRMVYTYNKRYTANLADQVYHAVQSLPNLRCVDYHQVTVRDRQQLQASTLMKKRNALIVNIDIQNLSIIESIDHDQVFADLFEVDEDGKFVGGCVIESFSVKCPMTSFSGIPVLRGILHTVLSLQCGKRQQWAAAETTGTANQSVEPTSTAGQLAGVESFLSGQQIAKPASVPWSSLRKLHVLVPITSRCLALIPPFAHTIQSLRLSPADLKVCGVTATQHFAHLFERYSWPSLRSLWLLGDFFVRSAPLPKSTAEAIVKNCPVVEELHIHHSAFETAEVLAKLITELSVLKSFQINSIIILNTATRRTH